MKFHLNGCDQESLLLLVWACLVQGAVSLLEDLSECFSARLQRFSFYAGLWALCFSRSLACASCILYDRCISYVVCVVCVYSREGGRYPNNYCNITAQIDTTLKLNDCVLWLKTDRTESEGSQFLLLYTFSWHFSCSVVRVLRIPTDISYQCSRLLAFPITSYIASDTAFLQPKI